MISHEHKFIFIHINKTGGSSIEQAFLGEYQINNKHVFLKTYAKRREYKQYFKFTFVRNPWDKVVSQYEFRKRMKDAHVFPEGMTFEDFVYNPVGRRFQNQLDWITVNGQVAVDFIGRFETLQRDFDIICDKLNVHRMLLPHVHRSERQHYSEYYTKKTRDHIADIFAKDIEYFDYVY